MTTLSFDSDNTLSGALFGMTPREAITLGIQLCEQVERSVGADGCHGNIWPGNISCANGQTAIGPAGNAGITELSPEALEYVSPEQFWSGECKPASDVYSIGLVLYTALNGGVMPFFTPDGERNAAARASALQNRMKGRVPAYPAAAGRELGDVVLKALSFKAWPNLPANQILTGTVQSRLGQMLCKASGISGGETVRSISDAALHTLAKVCKDFALPVTGVSGLESAQVTAGGIKTAEFDPETMQSRLVPGLYACGEVLDIDGDCGGYNLQWAWASGLLAGGAV